MQTFEVVCPVFNEKEAIPVFVERISKVFDCLVGRYSCKLLFIDNCSSDGSLEILLDLAERFDWVIVVEMSRNFGYQVSVECGLRNSIGDITGVIDVDCEDPPELFVDFLAQIEGGYDIVYGERADREECLPLKLLRKLYYRVTRAAADELFLLDMAEFCAMRKDVREAVNRDATSFPFIRASIGRVGFDIKNIPYKRSRRSVGRTHYSLFGMWVFGFAGLLSSSTLWLRLPAYLFPFWILLLGFLAWLAIAFSSQASIVLLILAGFGFLGFVTVGLALYTARIYKNGLQRPNYHVNFRKSALKGRQLL
ncbi:MAG: glycosyltransferase [Verrucomicrobia bacterium]|nr:glycosyltransferase [Verrucomicrobiota bacterium]